MAAGPGGLGRGQVITAAGLLVTPHIAGATTQAESRAMAIAGDQLARYAAGQPLRNVVGDQGY